MKASKQSSAASKPTDSVWDIARTIFYALLIALTFRTLLFQPFSIPSGSMKPTLLVGDYLFVSKYAYGYSKYSLPWGRLLPLEGRFFSASPERGDVVVFARPSDPKIDYIKRIVGLPGDRIEMRAGVLHINGEAVEMISDGVFRETRTPINRNAEPNRNTCLSEHSDRDYCGKEQFIEVLPNGVRHVIVNGDSNTRSHDNGDFGTVPEGHYFFLGDNRDNSQDSRAGRLNPIRRLGGFVPAEYLIGRAEIVMVSSEDQFWQVWLWRASRFLKWID